MCACVSACVMCGLCVCVRACVCACVCACARACVPARVSFEYFKITINDLLIVT